MMDTDKVIGANLARFRAEMPQQELADHMRRIGFKWSQATVWEVEKGKRPLRLAEAWELSKLLRCRVESLIRPTGQAQFVSNVQAWRVRIESAMAQVREASLHLFEEHRKLAGAVAHFRYVMPQEWEDQEFYNEAEGVLEHLEELSNMPFGDVLRIGAGEAIATDAAQTGEVAADGEHQEEA